MSSGYIQTQIHQVRNRTRPRNKRNKHSATAIRLSIAIAAGRTWRPADRAAPALYLITLPAALMAYHVPPNSGVPT